MDEQPYPLSKTVIWVMCLAMTPLCGSVLYYVWKKDHLAAANFANRVSWLSWLLWILAYVGYHQLRA